MSAHEKRIQETLAQAFAKRGFRHEAITTRTPLDDLLAKEEPADVQEERREALGAMMRFFFADGPHLGCVVRRVFAIGKAITPELIAHMTVEELAQMFDETKAAQSWRIKKIFSDYQRDRGVKGFKAPFQKSEESRAAFSRAQRGNTNRRAKAKIRTAA